MTDWHAESRRSGGRGVALAGAAVIILVVMAGAEALTFNSATVMRSDSPEAALLSAKRRSRSIEAMAENRLRAEPRPAQSEAAPSAASVVAARVAEENAETAVRAAEAELRAVRMALADEPPSALRTADELHLQQELVAARRHLIHAQRDRVVASYAVAAAGKSDQFGDLAISGHIGDFGPP